MRTFLRLLLGFTPLALGYAMDQALLNFEIAPLTLSLLFLALWGGLSFLLCRSRRSAFISACIVQVPSLIALLCILYQELVLGAYWQNLAGVLPQLFFLPTISAASRVALSIPQFAGILTEWRLWPIYVIGFLLMLLVSWAGGKLKPKRAS